MPGIRGMRPSPLHRLLLETGYTPLVYLVGVAHACFFLVIMNSDDDPRTPLFSSSITTITFTQPLHNFPAAVLHKARSAAHWPSGRLPCLVVPRSLVCVHARMPTQDLPVERKTVKALALLSLKRTYDMFAPNHGEKLPLDETR